MHAYLERGTIPEPRGKIFGGLQIEKTKAEIDSLVLEWYKYASQAGVAHSSKTSAHVTPHKLWYKIPNDGSDAYVLNVAIDPLKDALMCQEGLYLLLGFTHHRMESIISCVKTTGVMKLHGLHGKKSNNATTNTVISKLMDHFHELSQLGEVRATKVVATLVDGAVGTVNRKNNKEDIYLPTSDGYRPCYYRYLK